MLAPLLVMVREGVEAALIIGIIAAYLVRSGRRALLKPMWLGVALAVVVCGAVGITLSAIGAELPEQQQELFAGIVALVAVGVLTWMVFWMRKAGRSIKTELHDKIETAAAKSSGAWPVAVVAMAFFAVAREGVESALFLMAIFNSTSAATGPAVLGAVLGLGIAAGLGWAIYAGSSKLDLRKFFTYTGVFVIIVAAGLLVNGLGALHEAGVWNLLQGEVWNTAAALPEKGALGSVLHAVLGYNEEMTIGQLLAWVLYLVPVMTLFLVGSRGPARSAKPVAPVGGAQKAPVSA